MYSARVVVVEESNEYVVFELEYCCCELHFFVRLPALANPDELAIPVP